MHQCSQLPLTGVGVTCQGETVSRPRLHRPAAADEVLAEDETTFSGLLFSVLTVLGMTELVFHCVGHEKAAMEHSNSCRLAEVAFFSAYEGGKPHGGWSDSAFTQKMGRKHSLAGPVRTCDLRMGLHGRLLLAGTVFVGQMN